MLTFAEIFFPDHSDKSSNKQLQPKMDDIGHENNKDKPVETPVSRTAPQNHPCTKQQWDLSKKNSPIRG